MLVAGDVSNSTIATLKSDGWVVKRVEAVQNPGLWSQGNKGGNTFPARFWAVYTKLLIFSLSSYERVVYLDADTIALQNLDSLFLCDGFCGVMRHSERLNTGVLVAQPSIDLFNDMMSKIGALPSYTGGDQGFLNSYFSNYASAPFFNPSRGQLLSELHPDSIDENSKTRIARLPTGFNADLGLFIFNSGRWTLLESEIHILHYTLASFKPWDWWSSWIIGESGDRWHALRDRLPASSDGRLYGSSWRHWFAWRVLTLVPLVIVGLMIRKQCCITSCLTLTEVFKLRICHHQMPLSAGTKYPPVGFSTAAIMAGVGSLLLALGVSVRFIVPDQISPYKGWILAYEWTAFLFVLCFSGYLCLCYRWGQRAVEGSSRVHASAPMPFGLTGLLLAVVIVVLGFTPWVSAVIGIPSFVAKVLLTAISCAVSLVICTQIFQVLAFAWYCVPNTSKKVDAYEGSPLKLFNV